MDLSGSPKRIGKSQEASRGSAQAARKDLVHMGSDQSAEKDLTLLGSEKDLALPPDRTGSLEVVKGKT